MADTARGEPDSAVGALAIVFAGHHISATLDAIRLQIGAPHGEASPSHLLRAARAHGLHGQTIHATVKELISVGPGAVLQWGFTEYVVLEGVDKHGASVIAAETGRRHADWRELESSFTGIVLQFEPIVAGAGSGPEPPSHNGASRRLLLTAIAQSGTLPTIVILSILLQALTIVFPVVFGLVVDGGLTFGNSLSLFGLCGAGAIAAVAFFLLTIMRADLIASLRTAVHWRLASNSFAHLTRRALSYFGARPSGDLAQRLNGIAQVREMLSGTALAAILDGGMACVVLVGISALSWRFSVVVMAIVASRAAVFLSTRSLARNNMMGVLVAQSRFEAFQLQSIAGIETVKSLRAETLVTGQWGARLVPALNRATERVVVNARIEALDSGVAFLSPFCVLGALAMELQAGRISLGMLLTLFAMGSLVLGALTSVVTTGYRLRDIASYLVRLDDVLVDSEGAVDDEASGEVDRKSLIRLQARGVVFTYHTHSDAIVKDVTIEIAAQSMCALVGVSGCGKSTLLRLLAGLRKPSAGQIAVITRHGVIQGAGGLRAWVTLVPQTPYIFGGTIQENLLLGNPRADAAAMEAVLRDVGLWEFLESGSGPLNRVVDEGGTSLSGGQRQRLAIARALLADAAILCLDEATSALDEASEREILKMLGRRRVTRIVVTHRLRAVEEADFIAVMSEGAIVEQGAHDSLVARGGRYSQLLAVKDEKSEAESC